MNILARQSEPGSLGFYMTYVSLYRKWRPQSFSQLVGQEHITRTLANSIKADRVGHAYLFAGPRGTGKTSTAKILAKSVNCLKGPTLEPCDKCESCVTIAGGTSLDVIEMDAASNRGIDEIRDLRDKVAFAATVGRSKVYIVDEVHMLTEHAFNALLKTLEEPPAHVIFILATTDPHKVPVTISSRCQHFEFRPISLPELIEHLLKIAKAEKISISKDAAATIARQAEGSLRDAIGILDQISTYTSKAITNDDVTNFLGLVDAGVIEAGVDLLISGQTDSVFEYIESLIKRGYDLRQFVGAFLVHLRDLFIVSQVKGEERLRLLVGPDDEALKRLQKQASSLGVARIRSITSEIGALYEKLRSTGEPRLAVELALIGIMTGEELTIEAMARRIEQLEKESLSIVSSSTTGSRAPVKAVKSARSADSDQEPKRPVKNQQKVAVPTKKDAESSGPIKKDAESSGSINLEVVKGAWANILSVAKKRKLSLYAFLIEGTPIGVANGSLSIGFKPKTAFASNELTKAPNVKIFKEILLEVLGCDLELAVTITSDTVDENSIDESVSTPAPEKKQDKIAEKELGKNDALDLIKESFGAEVVDEKVID